MFSLYDIRDLDLMLRLDETGGAGGATAKELAEAFGLKKEDTRKISTRLTWMRRFGMFAFDSKTGMWSLSESGERIVKAKTKAAAAKAIDAVPDDSLIETMAHVTTRYRLGDPVLATMLRREFAFGTSPRSVIWSAKGGGV